MKAIVVQRRYSAKVDMVANPTVFTTPMEQWVVGIIISDTYSVESVWDSVAAAAAMAAEADADFISHLDGVRA